MDEIKDRFVGKWKLDRSEHFEDFLRECGVNVFARKMAGLSTPVSEISVKDDDKVHISMFAHLMTQEDTFKLDEEFEKDMCGNKMMGKPSFVDGKIVIQYTPTNPNIKPQKVTKEVVNGELVQEYFAEILNVEVTNEFVNI